MAVPIDGDFANIVLPAQHYQQVLLDPFGINAVSESSKHAGANRFFIHKFMHVYFKKMPLFLQQFMDPVSSLYNSIAIIKLVLQLAMLFLLSQLITSTQNFRSKELFLGLIILIPFFQSFGYNDQMGIIFKPITYTCFYALPIVALLWFLFPYLLALRNGHFIYISPVRSFFMGMLLIMLPFSGPLISPLILILVPLIILGFFVSNASTKWPSQLNFSKIFWLIIIVLLSLYAMFLGAYNAENVGNHSITIFEKYQRMPKGFFDLISAKPGLAVLIGFALINAILVFIIKDKNVAHKKLLYFISAFIGMYLILLPFGGYRDYRPNIIGTDVFLPIILALLIFTISSSLFLINRLPAAYRIIPAAVFVIFTWADKPNFYYNHCEKNNLMGLNDLKKSENLIEDDCTIMAWDKIGDPTYSITNVKLLQELNVIEELKLYYQK